MKSHINAIEAVVRRYLEALYAGDVGVLGEVFAPNAALYAVADGEATSIALAPWLDRVKNRVSAKAQGFDSGNAILSIETEGSMALAKVTSAFPPKRFVDYLSLVETGTGWRIVAKTYHAEDVPVPGTTG